MKRALTLLCLLTVLLTVSAAHAASWSDLWLTQDQQGQRLLDSGKPADAARRFDDARRRAYAEIKAGQYAGAAQRLQGFGDPQSQYNRGNALARSGKLENALAAYDQAIKQTPAASALGRDARHNRELVAKQLEQQQPPPSKSAGQSQPQPQSGKNGKSGNNGQSQQGDQSQQQQGSEQNAANGSQQQKQPGQDTPGEQSQQRQASNQKPQASNQNPQASTQRTQGSQSESAASEAEQAQQDAAKSKHDAEAALAQAQQDESRKAMGQSAPQDGSKQRNGKPAAAAIDQPPSEQSLALEQWLRQIPDDPAGLLRRKFLIEHLKRERESRR
jgi:Ca-activated chloride channel family protein